MSSISSLSTSNADLFNASQNATYGGGISVDGTRISWPANGWYEVQSATSYNTMSEGGTSASMPHGTYNVINHTTGERFENIQVPSSENARFANSSSKQSSQLTSTSQQNSQADAGKESGQDKPLLTITIPAGTVNNELHLNNGVVIDVEEATGEPMTDTTIEVRPEDNGDDLGFGQGMAIGSGLTTFGGYLAGKIGAAATATGLGVVGVGLTVVGLATAFFDFEAKPTNPQTGHNSTDENDLNGDGFVSGSESAETGNFGTNPEGEFGGTPTAPVAEPVAPPAITITTDSTSNANKNSDSDTDNGAGGGGVSSSQSASDGGWGSSEGGEFG